jgi:hypothetical protein
MTWCTLHTTSFTGYIQRGTTHPPPSHAPEASFGGLGSPNPHAWNHDRWSSTCAGSNSSSLKVNALYCSGHQHQPNGQGRALGCAGNTEQELSTARALVHAVYQSSVKDLIGISTYDVFWTCIRSKAVLVSLGEDHSGEKLLALSCMLLTGAKGPANPSTAEIIARAAITAVRGANIFRPPNLHAPEIFRLLTRRNF